MQTTGKKPAARPKKTMTRKDDPEQSRLFIEKAREVGADAKKSAATDKVMGRLAAHEPKPHKKNRDG